MADTGKQSPLGVNVLGSILQNTGFYINKTTQDYIGVNKSTSGPYIPGRLVNDTCLKFLTQAIHKAYTRGAASQTNPTSPTGSYTVDSETYNNMLNIGQSLVPALGNSPPPTYVTTDPSNVWVNQHTDYVPPTIPRFSRSVQAGAPANSGYGFYDWDSPEYDDEDNRLLSYQNEGQNASWFPFLSTVEDPDAPGTYLTVPNRMITQYGWIRCIALQAWNEFNYNGNSVEQLDNTPTGSPEYRNFIDSFSTADGFINYSNQSIFAIENSQNFLKGTYSNQNDLITADISGVSLSSRSFGQDLINLGKALSLQSMSTFGLPSNLLQTLQNNNALTQPLILALFASGLNQAEIDNISKGIITPTKLQEQKIYSAYLGIVGSDLYTILITLNCKTKNINTLADLLNVKKMFPLSFTTLTVPIYNTNPGPTNSKTYYLLFVKQELNPQLIAPKVKTIVGSIVPPLPPPVEEDIVKIPAIVQEPINATTITKLGGGGCVVLESYIPYVEHDKKHNMKDITNAYMLEQDMKISLGNTDLKTSTGIVKKVLNDVQPCVKVTTSDGISLVCSITAQLLSKESGYISAIDSYGKNIAVMRNNRTWYDEVVSIDNVGNKFVRVIDAGGNGFWAGSVPGSYVLHHNVNISQEFNFEKK